MRWSKFFRAASLLAVSSLLSNCSIVRNELRSSGGAGGAILDKRIFPASESKQLQLLRASILISVTSRMALGTIRDGREADAFVDYLQNATAELNFLSGHLWPIEGNEANTMKWPCGRFTPLDAATYSQLAENTYDIDAYRKDCLTYSALFEADLPDLEYKIVRLAVASLPQQQAQKFLEAIRGGNMLGMAWEFLKLAEAAGDGLHRGGAAYRSSQEIVALAMLAGKEDGCRRWKVGLSQQNRPSNRANGRPTEILTVEDAVTCLGLSHDQLLKGHEEIPASEWPYRVSGEAFLALFGLAQRACYSLPIAVEAGTNASDQVNNDNIKERREACQQIQFRPKLRFGGLVKMRSEPPAATVPGVPQAPTAPADQPTVPADQSPG